MLNVIAMAQKAFPYSHSKILNYCFACVSGNGSHERSYFLFKFGNRGRLIFIDIIFCVAPQKKVQWAKVRECEAQMWEAFKEISLSSNFSDNNFRVSTAV